MNWFTISILPRHNHSFLNLNISMTWPVRTRRSPEQSRHKIIPKRVEFLWSARNKTRVSQNIRKSIRSNSNSPTYIGPRRHMHLSFLFSFFSCFFFFFLFLFLRFLEVASKDRETRTSLYHRGLIPPWAPRVGPQFPVWSAANSLAGNPSGETKRAIVSKLPRVRRWDGEGSRKLETVYVTPKIISVHATETNESMTAVFPFQCIISVLKYCRWRIQN